MTAGRSVSLLRDPTFARLWFVQASTQVGGNMALYALTILVFATTRSNTAVSALVMSFLVPPIFLSAMAGVIVDRLDVRWALVGPNVARAILTLGLALAGANVGLLLALNLGVSLTSVMLTPAEAAMIPRVVSRDRLETAMGIFNLTLQAAFAVGFAFLGPLLVAIAGPSIVLAVVTVMYVAATVACIGLPESPPLARGPHVASRAVHEAIAQLGEGFVAIRGDLEVGRPLLHLATSASLVGVLSVLGPDLATSLGLEPERLIVIVLPLGIGVIGGVLGLRRFGQGVSRRRAAELALAAFGLLSMAIATAGPIAESLATSGVPSLPVVGALGSPIPVVAMLAFLAGAAYAATTVSAQTALFEQMPAAIRGRVFGVLASIVSAASLVPILFAGPLADRITAPVVVIAVGAAVVVTAALSAAVFGSRR